MLNRFCVVCGIPVKRLGTKRCRNCYGPYLSKLVTGKKKTKEHIAKLSGKNHANWKGGRSVNHYGYVLLLRKDHPNAMTYGYVFEHRLVMEKELGRYLTRDERVHHIDGDKKNNDISNLILFKTHSKHMKYEHKQRRKV